MAYPRNLLNVDEEIVLDLKPHWLAVAPPALALVAALVLSFAVVIWDLNGTVDKVASAVALVVLLVVLVWFAFRVVSWASTNFTLTTDRLISRYGVLSKSGVEIPLDRINTVFFNQSLFERVMGAGDLAIESAGERGNQSFANIRKPAIVQREIYVQVEANENRKFDRAARHGGGTGLSIAEQLEKLHDLVTKGALTPEQFEAEKARLLGS